MADRSQATSGDSAGRSAPRGPALRAELEGDNKKIEQLQQAMTSLPRVDDQGRSDAPHAGELYQHKEALEAEVNAIAQRLAGYAAQLETELRRCQRNLKTLTHNAGRAKRREVLDPLDDATDAQKLECEHVGQDLDAVTIVLERALSVLRVSEKRKWPKGTPPPDTERRSPAGPDRRPGGKPNSPRAPRGPSGSKHDTDRELTDLLEAGPIRKRGKRKSS